MPVSEVSGLTLIIPGTRSGWCDCGKQKKPPDKRLLSGDGGIRTLVPVTRQLDFESSSLWPLRYVSSAYLLYYGFDGISNTFS